MADEAGTDAPKPISDELRAALQRLANLQAIDNRCSPNASPDKAMADLERATSYGMR